MKFTCLQENLTQALNKVYRAVPTKSELPILSNILISAADDRITLSATNLSTTITTNIGASIDKEGSITIPAKMFRDFVSNLGSTTIEAVLKDDILHVSSESTKSKFNGVPSDDFPDLPEEKKNLETIKIDPQKFYKAVSNVAFCASIDDSRPVFTGILVNFDGKKIILAASDGFRLAEAKMDVESKGSPFKIIIPAKTLIDVSKVFSDIDKPIKFTLDQNENLAMFSQEDTLIATRIIDGDYPDYTKIIPDKTSTNLNFTSQEFMEAVKLTDIFAKNDSAVIMKIDPDGFIELSASAQEAGEHLSKKKAEIGNAEKVQVGFNSKFLLDFLNNIKHEKISIMTNGSSSPCLFKPTQEDEDYIHIIMPMQINL